MRAKDPEIAVDPNLALEQQQAQNTLVSSLQTQAQGDTASLMARYGTRLALSSAGMSPTGAAPASPTIGTALAAMQSGGIGGLLKSVA